MTEIENNELEIRRLVAESLYAPVNARLDYTRQNKIDFAHYTASSTAFDIIKNRCFWLRNSRLMNDSSEMSLGLKTVQLNFDESGQAGGAFWQAMRNIDPYFKDKVDDIFQQRANQVFSQTYIGCLSEYLPSKIGGNLGRLSMWRAYGYPNGVALIFDGSAINSENMTLDVGSYPVFYPDYGVALPELARSIMALADNVHKLSDYDSQLIAKVITDFMIHLAIGIKDSNFHEEAEWRIVYRDGVFSNQISKKEPQVIAGIPQLICSVPLDDSRPLSLKRILKKIIIGPTEAPELAKDAFVQLLSNEGFDDPELKVVISNIPYRE